MLDGYRSINCVPFIAAADEGSFSAGRRLHRAQSVVSQTLANLKAQLGVRLFDRGARFPVLTHQGRALLRSGARQRRVGAVNAEDTPVEGMVIVMSALYRADNPPGPAGRWFIDRLKQCAAPDEPKKARRR